MKNQLTSVEKQSLIEAIKQAFARSPDASKVTILEQALASSGLTDRIQSSSSNATCWVNIANGLPRRSTTSKNPKATASVSAIDRLVAARHEIVEGLKQIDYERQAIHNRLKELDDLHAKYSKLV